MKIDAKRIQATNDLKPPTSKNETSRVGFVNYLRKYIPNLSEIPCPLRELLKSNVVFNWLEAHDKVLEKIKNIVSNSQTLIQVKK